jgi:hypothetical protein
VNTAFRFAYGGKLSHSFVSDVNDTFMNWFNTGSGGTMQGRSTIGGVKRRWARLWMQNGYFDAGCKKAGAISAGKVRHLRLGGSHGIIPRIAACRSRG